MTLRYVLLLLIVPLLFFYIQRKFFRLFPKKTKPSRFISWAFTLFAFSVVLGWQILYRNSPTSVSENWFTCLSWIGSLTMGLMATFIVFNLFFDLAQLVFTLTHSLLRKVTNAKPRS